MTDPPAGAPEPTPQPPQPPRRRRYARSARRIALAVLILIVSVPVGFRIWRWAAVSGDAPLLGLSLSTTWYHRIGVTQAAYETALARANARTAGIRPGWEDPEAFLDRIDGLVLCGGGDIDPALYGGDPVVAIGVDRAQDDIELALIRGALRRGMPILGICRGIQILNVARGGTLRNLRSDEKLGPAHGIGLESLTAHTVEIAPGSRLAGIEGAGPKHVNSFHGQAVDTLGKGLIAAAQSPDGVIEAVELPGDTLVLGLQWHPEVLSLEDAAELAVFRKFVRAAEEYRDRER